MTENQYRRAKIKKQHPFCFFAADSDFNTNFIQKICRTDTKGTGQKLIPKLNGVTDFGIIKLSPKRNAGNSVNSINRYRPNSKDYIYEYMINCC